MVPEDLVGLLRPHSEEEVLHAHVCLTVCVRVLRLTDRNKDGTYTYTYTHTQRRGGPPCSCVPHLRGATTVVLQ
jgi:hypothetical protein